MTTYSAIANSEIAVGAPITNNLMTKLRDNPLAIQENDASAPDVQYAVSAGNADTVDSYHASQLLAFSNHTGTISTGQVASGIISQAKLNTTTTSQSASIADTAEATISMNAYSFREDYECSVDIDYLPVNGTSASADSPQFRIRNQSGGGGTYSVAWRYVVA